MTEKVILVPTSTEKVIPALNGKRIGPEGVKVDKSPMHPYYSRRLMQGDLAVQRKEPASYAIDDKPKKASRSKED